MSAISMPVSTSHRPKRRHFAARLAFVILAAFAIGWSLNRISLRLEKSQRPAGFARGVIQGALMPAAMPNLMVGRDIAIYSVNNNGVFYKLGYTMGVNACGALFFGAFYCRVNRWRRA